MDLRKRLADLDRLNRKNKGDSDSQSHRPGLDLDDALRQLKLELRDAGSPPLWTRTYSDPTPVLPREIPSLVGFFTRAEEASPGLEDVLFLDTETTGLAGGTGTLAFLVGVGWIRDDTFHSLQYFLPDFVHEARMLEDLTALAKDFEVVMTFNGASFDLPLLRTRALMNRLADPCGELVSWDLLVPGRRLWGKTFADCRQQTLENGLLDLQRGPDDIEGALIPQTWFDFVKTGNTGLLANVLHHNQKDLLGMVGIFAQVLDMARRLHDNASGNDTWREAWALGRIAEKSRLTGTAANWMQRAVSDSRILGDGGFESRPFVADALRLLKRQGDWELVEKVIVEAFAAGHIEPWLHREAAILYEHRLVRLEIALSHAHRCGEPARVQRLETKNRKNVRGSHEPSEKT
jgi:uncharacterized protein